VANCIFCERRFVRGHPERERSGEHAWPKWLANALPGGGDQTITHKYDPFLNPGPPRSWNSKGFDLVAKVACRGCNHGWMEKTIEHPAKPHLWPAIQGAGVTYTSSARERIAYWALKTAMMIDWTHGQPARSVPPETYPELHAAQRVLPGTFVWIGGWNTDDACFGQNGSLHFAADKGDFTSMWFGVLGVGALVLLVVRVQDVSQTSLRLEDERLGGPKLLPIWPHFEPVMFPPVPVGTLFTRDSLGILPIQLMAGEALKPAQA
jgi:hypothetical protein